MGNLIEQNYVVVGFTYHYDGLGKWLKVGFENAGIEAHIIEEPRPLDSGLDRFEQTSAIAKSQFGRVIYLIDVLPVYDTPGRLNRVAATLFDEGHTVCRLRWDSMRTTAEQLYRNYLRDWSAEFNVVGKDSPFTIVAKVSEMIHNPDAKV